MSAFFVILSAAMYAACHLLARSTRPTHHYSFKHEILFDGTKTKLLKALDEWIAANPHYRIIAQNDDSVIIEKPTTFFHFGSYLYFKVHPGDGSLIVSIATQPKLISTGNERTLILDKISRVLENYKEAA